MKLDERADSRKWLREGWVDYLAPQLYWGEERRETSFRALVEWWTGENVHHRYVWPGLDISRVGRSRGPEEIVSQVRLTRDQSGSAGNIHWGADRLIKNQQGLADVLVKQVYASPALVPAMPWLSNQTPGRPEISASQNPAGEVKVVCKPTGAEPIGWWLVQTRNGGAWKVEVRPGFQSEEAILLRGKPDAIGVSAVDRFGNASAAAVLEWQRAPDPTPAR